MLPAWLGWEDAVQGHRAWRGRAVVPYAQGVAVLHHRIDMLEMVLAKADRKLPNSTTSAWCNRNCDRRCAFATPVLRWLRGAGAGQGGPNCSPRRRDARIHCVRNTYLDPLHLLRPSCWPLATLRRQLPCGGLEQAMLVTVAGIAAGCLPVEAHHPHQRWIAEPANGVLMAVRVPSSAGTGFARSHMGSLSGRTAVYREQTLSAHVCAVQPR